jgi:hypothetical protein
VDSAGRPFRRSAFESARPGGVGGGGVYLYDRRSASPVALPGVNSSAFDQAARLN